MLMTNSTEEKLYYVLPLVRLHPLSLLPEMLVRNDSFKFCKIKTNCFKRGIMDDQQGAMNRTSGAKNGQYQNWSHVFLCKTTHFSQFGGTRNGTSGAKIKMLRSPTPPNKPPKPPKSHLRNPNRTSKSHFWPFCVFLIFLPHFPLSTGHNIKCQIYKGRRPQIKKCQKQTHFKIQFYIGVCDVLLGCIYI